MHKKFTKVVLGEQQISDEIRDAVCKLYNEALEQKLDKFDIEAFINAHLKERYQNRKIVATVTSEQMPTIKDHDYITMDNFEVGYKEYVMIIEY